MSAEDWRAVKLGEIANIQQGRWLPIEMQLGGPSPVFGANGVTGWTEKGHYEHEVIALGCRGTCGAINMAPPGSWLGNNVMALWPRNTAEVSLAFLRATVASSGTESVTKKNAQPMISRADLSGLVVAFPPPADQRRIVDLLAAADSMVVAAAGEVELAVRLRGQVLFDVHRSLCEKRASRLSDVAVWRKGVKPRVVSESSGPGLEPYLSTRTLRSGPRATWALPENRSVRCAEDDVLVAWDGTAGEVFWGVEGIVASTMALVRPKANAAAPEAVQLTLRASSEILKSTAKGTTIPHIDPVAFGGLQVPDLSDAEAANLRLLLSECDTRVAAASSRLDAAKHLRGQLLHDLLSGTHRIPESYDRLLGDAKGVM